MYVSISICTYYVYVNVYPCLQWYLYLGLFYFYLYLHVCPSSFCLYVSIYANCCLFSMLISIFMFASLHGYFNLSSLQGGVRLAGGASGVRLATLAARSAKKAFKARCCVVAEMCCSNYTYGSMICWNMFAANAVRRWASRLFTALRLGSCAAGGLMGFAHPAQFEKQLFYSRHERARCRCRRT